MFDSSLDTVLTVFNGQVAVRQDPGEGSQKLRVQRFCLACCSLTSLTLPIGAPEGLGDIQIFAKSVSNFCNLSSKHG